MGWILSNDLDDDVLLLWRPHWLGKHNSEKYVLNIFGDVDFGEVLEHWREPMAEIDFLFWN